MAKRLFVSLFALLLSISTCIPCTASAYDAHPKLVVILVIDQFREDYLERYRADFKGNGFDLFLDHGAYFPDCYFDYANLVTAPGHSAISTGAYSDGNGIASNEWWDLARNANRPISSVEDPRYSIVGLPTTAAQSPREGASPRNLLASTIGDEVRLATKGESKLFGISLKDRAAILTSGHTANGAFWIDPQSGAFITSTYYMSSLPDWATTFNQGDNATQARTAAGVAADVPFFSAVGPTDAAIQYELNFAQALIQGENLGAGNVTDVLTISISSTDILGHRVGPDSPDQRQLVDQLDGNLDQFFTWLDHNVPGGLHNVWLVLTADHGVAPVPANAQQLGIPAASIPMKPVIAELNKNMNGRFSPGQDLEYLLPDQDLPYISLNIPTFERAGINEFEAERAIQDSIPAAVASLNPSADKPDDAVQPGNKRLTPRPRVFRTFTRLQLASLQPGLPPTEFGRLMAHSYSPNGGWYVMLIPDAYQVPGSGHGATHFSVYSYDRHVPLGFYGSVFTPGTFRGRVQPVDIAATLADLLGVNQPSASIGQILTQAIHPEVEIKSKHEELRRRRHHETSPPTHREAPEKKGETPSKPHSIEHTPPSTRSSTSPTPKAPASPGPEL
ncbi:MAG TPA: alkaline phosphatase family protein [Acidobacteriaceae bacterium]|nr:alkaline phosphatase family protein [Acidobacteriaceae bacterium]